MQIAYLKSRHRVKRNLIFFHCTIDIRILIIIKIAYVNSLGLISLIRLYTIVFKLRLSCRQHVLYRQLQRVHFRQQEQVH
jgi:hypothetical protein